MKTIRVKITLNDVRRAGSVRAALAAYCEASDEVAGGVVGSEFSTSGPGSGWSCQHDVCDFARRAIEGGALYYLDLDDGRIVEAEEVDDDEQTEDGEWPYDVIHDLGGGQSRLGDWSDESVVRLVVPSEEDALRYPDLTAEMAQAVIDTHGAESDRAAWRSLVATMRSACEALSAIDPDDILRID